MHLDNIGDVLLPKTVELLNTKGITLPETFDAEIELKDNNLSVKWKTSIGTFGATTVPRTGEALDLKPLSISNWVDFKAYVSTLEPNRYIFRGHEKSTWKLQTSFYRSQRCGLKRYAEIDINELHKIVSAQTSFFNLSDPLQFAALVNLAQHHGYPTPLLDWTWSPYVAAWFAYRNISKGNRNISKGKFINIYQRGKFIPFGTIRIYKLDCVEWNKLARTNKIFPFHPNMTILNTLAMYNQRAIPQQGISTYCNVSDIEAHIKRTEAQQGKTYLEVIDLPASARNQIMSELAMMNITAGSLFPGLDGACESLKERNF
jgi:FRG domain